MILLRPRNVAPCRLTQWTTSLVDGGLPGRPVSRTVFFRYHYSFGNFRHRFFYVVFSPGAVGIHATSGVAQRIVSCSSLWFASLGFSTGHGLLHRTLAFSSIPKVYIRVPSGVDIHTSLASGFHVPASHLFPFLRLFPPQCVSITGSLPHCMLS